MQGASESNMAASSSARPKFNRYNGKLSPKQLNNEERIHEENALKHGVGSCGPFAWGQVSETPQRRTTTEGNGTITDYTPGSAIVLRESSGPRRYRFGKTVTYVTRSGRTLDEDTVNES